MLRHLEIPGTLRLHRNRFCPGRARRRCCLDCSAWLVRWVEGVAGSVEQDAKMTPDDTSIQLVSHALLAAVRNTSARQHAEHCGAGQGIDAIADFSRQSVNQYSMHD